MHFFTSQYLVLISPFSLIIIEYLYCRVFVAKERRNTGSICTTSLYDYSI